MEVFTTRINKKYLFLATLKRLWIPFTIICGLAFLALFYNVPLFILIEAACLFSFAFSVYISYAKYKDTTITVEHNLISIDGKTQMSHFEIYDNPASDFIFSQTKKEKSADCGSMKINNTIFAVHGIANFEKTKRSILEAFKDNH